MAVMNGGVTATEKPNEGVLVGEEEAKGKDVLKQLIESILDPPPPPSPSLHQNENENQNSNSNSNSRSVSVSGMWCNRNRIKKSLLEAAPMFREAILKDLHHGSSLRALFLLSVGIVGLLGLTGLVVFTLFFVAATVNAIIISLLVSLAAVGGFLAIFFACLTAMYIAMLFIAAFVTFTITISSIIAALFPAGWIGLIWMTWLAVSKGVSLAKRSLGQLQANVSKE